MSTSLEDRLAQILPTITNESFLNSDGIGNEIACYIFDYPEDQELVVREHIGLILKRIELQHKSLKVLHLNLFDVVLDYLRTRKLLSKTLEMQNSKGTAAVLRALKGPVSAEKIKQFIGSEYDPSNYDMLLLSGVGNVWPMLRAHGLLNSMHTIMDSKPLVLFYPGSFDGTTLRLFGRVDSSTAKPCKKAYYRAFTLVPGGSQV